jgi:outer membrane protein TolC
MRILGLMLLIALLSGCTRTFYRTSADREVYGAIDERDHDPRWALPRIDVYPSPDSRLYDPFDPDHPPLPPDDPAAFRYMKRANGIRGYRHWHKDGDAPWIEDPDWRNTLPLDEKGVLNLTPQRAVGLGLLNSPDYQIQLENLYLTALTLTLNRFEFDLHWFGTNATTFTHFGSGADELNTLTTASDLGFSKALAAGGQFMIDFANTFVFQYAGPDQVNTNSNIAISLTQPLLRFAGRYVRMEGLTQAERNLLYQVRTFAHFRKQFTFQIATQGYLSLLAQEQQIRNARANLASLEQNFRLHEALLASGIVSLVKVDQVFQNVQQGRLNLIQSEAALETQEDIYKGTLGLPPNIPIHLDDAILEPFQLNDPGLMDLQGVMDGFLAEYRELDQAPALVKLEDGFRRLQELQTRLAPFVDEVGEEMGRWQKSLEEAGRDPERIARERRAQEELSKELEEIRKDLAKLTRAIVAAHAALAEDKRKAGWEALLDRTRDLSAAAAQVSIIQTQVRVYLIKLKPVPYRLEEAEQYALANRLDLMNQRGAVVDAWRKIAVTASALKTGLDVVFNANIATPPVGVNPFDFRSSASTYSVGTRLDTPLNRLAERNAYRASQITYEQSRRAFMVLKDQIERAIRLDLRQLNTARLNFEIARQSLVIAARSVEGAREELLQLGANADPTSTQNILNALSDVLRNQNALIDSWVSYETGRMQLLLDLEALQVDAEGNYLDEHIPQSEPVASSGGAGQPAGPAPQSGRSPYAQPPPPPVP